MKTSGVHVRSSVQVTANSYTRPANEIIRIFLEAIARGGLDPTEFVDNQDALEDGLRSWQALRQLDVAYLEIFDLHSDEVRARIDIGIIYRDGGDNFYQTDVARIRSSLGAAGKFDKCRYRIVAGTVDSAAEMHGWTETQLRSASQLSQYEIGAAITAAPPVGQYLTISNSSHRASIPGDS